MKRHYVLFIFILGIAVGIIGWNIVGLGAPSPAYAQARGENDGESASGLIALTGLIQNSDSALWVIDARDTDHSPSVALYIPDGKRGLKFIGARRIKYDLQIVQYNDKSDRRVKVSKMKQAVKKAEEMSKRDEKKGK